MAFIDIYSSSANDVIDLLLWEVFLFKVYVVLIQSPLQVPQLGIWVHLFTLRQNADAVDCISKLNIF
jgi:hypothetical protein